MTTQQDTRAAEKRVAEKEPRSMASDVLTPKKTPSWTFGAIAGGLLLGLPLLVTALFYYTSVSF